MNRLCAAALALAVLSPVAQAAEVTRLASSFEDDHPFGFFLDVGFERTQRRELISREGHGTLAGGTTPAIVDLPELRYTGVDYRLNVDAHVGIWKDLEFHYGLPIVFASTEQWWLASPSNPATSTVMPGSPNNCIRPDGTLVSPSCTTTGAGSTDLFPGGIPQSQFRGGLGNMRFGLAYAFFNQQKDDTKPTWIVGLEYEAPTAQLNDPTAPATDSEHGNIGDRVHKYTPYTTFSRKIGAIEPYFHIETTLPARGSGWYSNCDHPSADNMAYPQNCNSSDWTRSDAGIQSPVTAQAYFGAEFNILDEKEKHQRLGIDLRLQSQFTGAGRYYDELSGLLQKYLYSDDYFQVGGTLGVNAHASDYVRIQARATLLYATPHTITDEPLGKDLNGDGRVDPTNASGEVNPNYDFRYDTEGRRFRASDIFTFRVDLTASFNF